ncbi:helix-turn-helix transcriptional regulator [Rhizobium sp. SJZ105]|uniref:helix-turn-helix transcriptional regulator n=1 Tax=Rhizobium sp. SJZ105 TaxID=2572678 RepID=UPI002AA52B33|nr:helix-turn-helix transcriptional regulator [Rhizobium sp. SJZ105]
MVDQRPVCADPILFQLIPRPVTKERLHLTDRQRQIVTLVSQGKTNSAIASELGLSPRTVESHRARLMHATGTRNAAELIARFSRP